MGADTQRDGDYQIIPNTIAARNPKDRSAVSTFSRVVSSIVASLTSGLRSLPVFFLFGGAGTLTVVKSLGSALLICQLKKLLHRERPPLNGVTSESLVSRTSAQRHTAVAGAHEKYAD